MEALFRKVFGGFLIKESKDGPVVISRTATEIEAIQAKAAMNKLPLISEKITPDIVSFRLKTRVSL